MNCIKKRSSRQKILIVSHADGHLEIFGEKNFDFHIARVPSATSRGAEIAAEEVTLMLLPRRYRDLFRADLLRKNGTTRPLLSSVLAASIRAKKDIELANGIGVKAPLILKKGRAW